MDATTPVAGWYPDPLDPVRLRYWDGAVWTEQVSVAADVGTTPDGPSAAPPGSGSVGPSRRWLVVGAAVAVVALVLALQSSEGADDGTGSFSGRVVSDDVALHRVQVPAGADLRVVATPEAEVDLIVGIAAQGPLAGAFGVEPLRNPIPGLPTGTAVVDTADEGGEGDVETLSQVVPLEGQVLVMVTGYGGDSGAYQIEIEVER